MSEEDVEYYRRRAATERALAQQADRQKVREIHEELARLYDALVEDKQLQGAAIRLSA